MDTARATVGRQREQERIDAALDGARAGRTRVLLFSGDPGIGKSRLVEDAALRAAERQMTVAWGRAWEAGGAPPYWPWIQILRALRKTDAGKNDVPELARLLPELGGAAAGDATSPQERFLLFDAVVRYLEACSAERPALLLLEDLHAADPATLQLLDFAAAHLRGARVALLGTYRLLEARLVPTTQALLERVGRNGESLEVRPLSLEAVSALAQGAAPDEVRWLFEATQGNPLFVREMLHVLGRSGRKRGELPEGVRAAIREHLKALPPELLPPLEVSAAIGRELSPLLLAAVCGLPAEVAMERLSAAVSLGVLVERAPSRFAFSHSLIAETLHQDLSPRRRAELHLEIARALEALHAQDATPPLAEIAHHLFEAGPQAAARAVQAAQAAAELSLRLLAFEQAQALVQRALAAQPADPAVKLELLLALGRTQLLSGSDDGCRAACKEAAALARAAGNAEWLARAALGYGAIFTFGTTDRTLVELLEGALAGLPPGDSALRALCHGRLAAALQPAANPQVPVRMAREAVAMARRLDDRRARLSVLHFASAAFARFAPVSERAPIDREALELAESLGEPFLAMRAHARLAFDCIEQGEPQEGWAHAAEYTALARLFRAPEVGWATEMFQAMRAMFEGRFDDHQRHLEAAIAAAGPQPGEVFRACINNHRLVQYRIEGSTEQFAAAMRGLIDALGNNSYLQLAQVITAAQGGELDRARDLMRGLTLEAAANYGDTGGNTWLAEAACATGDTQWAQVLYEWFLGREGENPAWYLHGMAVEPPVSLTLGRLARLLGKPDAARGHFARAVSQMRLQGGRPFEAHAQLALAELLAEGAPKDRDEARSRLASARAIDAELSLRLTARIDALSAALGAEARPLASTPPATAPTAVLALVREGEYWTLTGLGGTVRLKHSRGLEMLARLLLEPGRELSALDLSGADGAVDAGDAGEAIDDEAKAMYRSRLSELKEELAEAEEWNDSGRAARLRAEAEALQAELSRAVGLGGRSRRVGAAQERARINVQRRIADAIKRISEGFTPAGEHLQACIRTGAFCSYSAERANR